MSQFQPDDASLQPSALAGVAPNEQTQYGWLYPGGLLIESTEGWDDEFLGMYHLLVEGREYFTDDLEQLERIL